MADFIGYIYCITNSKNGKQYIGQTATTVHKRFTEHLRCARVDEESPYLLYRAIKKYGEENFNIETLLTIYASSRTELKEKLNEKEIYYIRIFNTYKPNGYNMTLGGFAFADHACRKVYQVQKDGLVIAKFESMAEADIINDLPLGSVSRALTYATHYAKGYYWFDDNNDSVRIGDYVDITIQKSRQPIYQFDLSGNLLATFSNISEASFATNIPQKTIYKASNGYRKSAYGYMWSYDESIENYMSNKGVCRSISVIQLTIDGEKIREYSSATEAARELGLQQSLISACCRGKRQSTGGYRWAFSM